MTQVTKLCVSKLLTRSCPSYSAHAERPSLNLSTYRRTNFGLRKRVKTCNNTETRHGKSSFLDRRSYFGAKLVFSKPLTTPVDCGIGIELHVLRETQNNIMSFALETK